MKNLESQQLESAAYIRYGIPAKNILTFEYEPGERILDNQEISRNLTQVLVNKSGVFKWSFDLKRTFRTGSMFPKEDRISDYKNEEFREFATKT